MSGIDDIYVDAVSPASTHFDPADDALQAINPPELFNGSSLFSQIIVAPVGRTVWISGLIGVTAENRLVGSDKAVQIRQAFRNIDAALTAAGCTPADCVRLTEYIVNYEEADLVILQSEITALFCPGRLPTNVIVPVPRLGRDGSLFEVELACVVRALS